MTLRIFRIGLLLGILASISAIPGLCGINEDFRDKIVNLKWIAYSPTNFDPERGIYPDQDSIRKDLQLLYKYGFRGVVTYGSLRTLGEIPWIARELGFSGVIMGVWDIDSREEIMNALLASEYVDGYCLGNEGLSSRYDLARLNSAIAAIKESTAKPVTTTEQVGDYSNDGIFLIGDWVFPNIHPFLSEVKSPKKAAVWIQKHYNWLNKHCQDDRVVFFKEVGFPTAGMWKASEANQDEFFREMEKSGMPFVYFEAFDQRWKDNPPCEPYWGLFGSKRKPKKYVSSLKINEDK